MSNLSVNVRFRLPFWWRPYVWAVRCLAFFGVAGDPQKHADFIVRHGKIKVR